MLIFRLCFQSVTRRFSVFVVWVRLFGSYLFVTFCREGIA